MTTNCTYDPFQNEFVLELDGATYALNQADFDTFAKQQFEAEREAAKTSRRDDMDAYHESLEQ